MNESLGGGGPTTNPSPPPRPNPDVYAHNETGGREMKPNSEPWNPKPEGEGREGGGAAPTSEPHGRPLPPSPPPLLPFAPPSPSPPSPLRFSSPNAGAPPCSAPSPSPPTAAAAVSAAAAAAAPLRGPPKPSSSRSSVSSGTLQPHPRSSLKLVNLQFGSSPNEVGSKGRYEADGLKAQLEPGDGPGTGLGADGPGGAAILEGLLNPQRPPENGAI